MFRTIVFSWLTLATIALGGAASCDNNAATNCCGATCAAPTACPSDQTCNSAGVCEAKPIVDAGVDAAQGCMKDADCTNAGAPVCNNTAQNPVGVCVQCTPSNDSACTGGTPVCGADFACHGCTTHAECGDDSACVMTGPMAGSCTDPSTTFHVNASGSVTADCTTAATACNTITRVLQVLPAAGASVLASGAINEPGEVVIDSVSFAVYGSGLTTTSFKRTTQGGFGVFSLSGTSQVDFHDLAITDSARCLSLRNTATTLTRAKCVCGDICVESASGGNLTLSHASITGANSEAILKVGGTLVIADSTIANNGLGIRVTGGSLVVARSMFTGSRFGAITITGNGSFDIQNSFVVRNGGVSGTVPAMTLATTGPNNKLLFNTIAENVMTTSMFSPRTSAAVVCSVSAGNLTEGYNVLYRNVRDGVALLSEQQQGTCIGATSYANVDALNPLQFVNPTTAPYDYHLTAGSPATVLNVAGSNCAGMVDFDGQSRPNGGACDLGADELHP